MNYMRKIMNFEDMETKYGPVAAYQMLTEIEKAAHIAPRPTDIDLEARLGAALRAQDAMLSPAVMLAAA
jgi:hypothetical protein